MKKNKKVQVTLYESERQKLEKEAWKKGMTLSAFIRMALDHEYKKILDEEVRQYEHSGMHSEIHKGARESDPDNSERGRADWFGDTYRETGTEG